MRTTRPLPSFEGVAVGSTATLRCPLGRTYDTILLSLTNMTMAELEGLRVIINGKTIQDYRTGTELNSMNLYEGRATFGTVLALDFVRHGLLTRDARELTAIGTGLGYIEGVNPFPISTLTIEIDIAAAASGVTIAAKALQRAPEPTGALKKVRRFEYSAPAAGADFQIGDLPRGDLINMVYWKCADDIDELTLEADNYTEWKRTIAENEMEQIDGVRTPQTLYYVFDPTDQGYGAEPFPTAGLNDLRFVASINSGASVPLALNTTVQYIGNLGN